MKYKYSLDRSSRKFMCPNCHKKTFVKYIDAETNHYLDSDIGRCDRESKCQYHKTPNGNKPLVNLDQPIIQTPPSSHNDKVLGYFGRNHTNNHFVSYLLKHFVPVDVKQAIERYYIGTSNYWNGATVFWQVDEQLNVCAGKVMLYNPETGKRVKKPYPHINWMHRVLQMNNFVLQQCLFGIHNLCDYSKGSTVCIVEAEKTAVIMSIIFPGYLWLATGSKSNLKKQLMLPLKPYKIILFPDKTEYKDWNTKMVNLKKCGFNMSCSSLLEHKNLEEGGDLVDLMLITSVI